MKKQLLAIALLTAGLANAQVWTQNFNGAVAPALPAGWMQNNVDGHTTSTVIASYNFGANAGVTRNVTTSFNIPNYQNSLITTSYYTPTGQSDDWVISPSFMVPANAVFNWEATSFDPVVTEGYEVRISTTGTTVSNFTVNPALFSTAGENYLSNTSSYTQRGVSLNAYAGQTVYLAIHDNSNNEWQAAYDNFAVTVPANATDGSMVNITGLSRYMVGAGNQNIAGTFQELGFATATTAVLNYKVNGGAVVTQTITFGPTVPYFGTSAFTFSTPANFVLGTNNVKVWVSAVNGTNEVVVTNDTAATVVYVASTSVARNALIEEFSSSTCPPCYNLNLVFDPLLASQTPSPNTGGNLNVVRYQVNWPDESNDPSYNADVQDRIAFAPYLINAVPSTIANGNTTVIVNNSQAELTAAEAVPAIAVITASLTMNGGSVVATSTITPHVGISAASPLVVYQVLAEANYTYVNPAQNSHQNSFYHVTRKMFPNGNGTPVTTIDGTAQTFSFSYAPTTASIIVTGTTLPAQGSNNFWTGVNITYEYVVFIQDAISGYVLQSGSANVLMPTGIVKYQNNSSIGVYPNPAKDYATVGIKLQNPSAVDISIYDITGKLVFSNKGSKLESGEFELKVNTSEFAAGAYNIHVTTADGVLKDKLIIAK